MKTKRITLLSLGLAIAYGLSSCGEKGHDHDDHDHGPGHEHEHDEGKESAQKEGETHDEHEDHDHDTIIAGPNGGRVLTIVEPHAEFFVTADRKVQIAFVDDDMKPVPAGEQEVDVVAGERANPTKLSFVKSGEVLLSEQSLPEGNDFPVVVQIKTSADAKAAREKFNLNMEECPTCENKEYACTCDHDD